MPFSRLKIPPESKGKGPSLLVALGVLLAGLALTGILWVQASRIAAEQIQNELQREASDISLGVERHLRSQELLLKGFEGLFNASDKVTRSDFHQYFQTLQTLGAFPLDQGTQGLAQPRRATPAAAVFAGEPLLHSPT